MFRQHCPLSICSYFGWAWQILRNTENLRRSRAGLSTYVLCFELTEWIGIDPLHVQTMSAFYRLFLRVASHVHTASCILVGRSGCVINCLVAKSQNHTDWNPTDDSTLMFSFQLVGSRFSTRVLLVVWDACVLQNRWIFGQFHQSPDTHGVISMCHLLQYSIWYSHKSLLDIG